jgi:uncharacterized membrane protein YoaK (UPF0700 family)
VVAVTSHADSPEARLRVAVLLSGAGGFLDAFTWIAHGRVFANAQTGNVVLLGVFATTGDWHQAARHLPPIVAFFGGVFLAQRLRRDASASALGRTALVTLGIEIVGLAVVMCLPAAVPDLPIVLAIAFLAGLQNSSFTKVEGLSYNSVMTTGNLRRTAETLFAAMSPGHDRDATRQARVFAAICGSFGLGALAGGLLTPVWSNAALAAPIALLGAAYLLCRRSLADPAITRS